MHLLAGDMHFSKIHVLTIVNFCGIVECLVAMYKHPIIAGASCMSTDCLFYQLAWLFSVRFCMGEPIPEHS